MIRSQSTRFYPLCATASSRHPTEPHREGRADSSADRTAGIGGRTDRGTRSLYRGAGGASGRAEPAAKTPGNSSKPPSQGQKQGRPAFGTDRPPRKSRPGVGRALHPNPDREIDRRLATCPRCEAVFPDASQTPQQVDDRPAFRSALADANETLGRKELPPVRPDVARVRLFGGRCACCGERATAKAPASLEQDSPFGSVHRRDGGVSTLCPCHRHGTAGAVDGRTVLAVDQRGRDLQHSGPSAGTSAGRHGGDRDSRAGQSGGRLRRGIGAGESQELVGGAASA